MLEPMRAAIRQHFKAFRRLIMLRCSFILLLLVMVATTACQSTPTLPSYPRTILGTITEISDRVLVEQQPGATIGDKILFSLSDETHIFQRVNSGLDAKTSGYLEVGQRVEVWADGVVLESWPGQAVAAVVVVTDPNKESTADTDMIMPPEREPDVSGTITQAYNTVLINHNLVLFITPTTEFLRRSGNTIETIDAREIKEGQRVDVWVENPPQPKDHPQARAQVIVVVDD
jgi:hypothetical protein